MKLELLDFIELDNYPAGSGIEFYDDKIYIVGDESSHLVMMGKKWNKPTVISLVEPSDKKNTNPSSPELETMTVLSVDKKPHLLVIGSGATEKRSKGVLLNLKNNALKPVDLTAFYNRIKAAAGISELNIEGVAEVYDYLVLVNRGTPANHLIITKRDFWKDQEKTSLQVILVDFESVGLTDPKLGISGLTYSDKHEDLFITISTEDPAADKNKPGKSYLAVIENLYRKIGREKGKLKINQLIDLSATDKRFEGYKMESVAVQSEKDHSVKMQLVADNDEGKTYLFKVWLSW